MPPKLSVATSRVLRRIVPSRRPEAQRIEQAVRELEKNVRRLEKASGRRAGEQSKQTVELVGAKVPVRLLAPSDLARMRRNALRKEPRTREWIESVTAAPGVLYDVGANVGAYTVYAAKLWDGAGEVVAFEPSFSSFDVLCRNIVLNAPAGRVIPLPITLGGSTGLGDFAYDSLESGAAWHGGGAPSLREDFTSAYTQPVLKYRLDDLIAVFDLPRPTAIKIDVDGAELGVLEGAHDTLRTSSLRTIMLEVAMANKPAVVELLLAAGFVESWTDEQERRAVEALVCNKLFERA